MSATEIATIFGALAVLITALGGIFGYWNTRQANQIKRLSDEADERIKERNSEREADRLDAEAKQKEFLFWRDAHQDLSKRYNDEPRIRNQQYSFTRSY